MWAIEHGVMTFPDPDPQESHHPPTSRLSWAPGLLSRRLLPLVLGSWSRCRGLYQSRESLWPPHASPGSAWRRARAPAPRPPPSRGSPEPGLGFGQNAACDLAGVRRGWGASAGRAAAAGPGAPGWARVPPAPPRWKSPAGLWARSCGRTRPLREWARRRDRSVWTNLLRITKNRLPSNFNCLIVTTWKPIILKPRINLQTSF